MATNVYEGMFILDSNRYARNPESVVGQIPKMIENAGGELLVSRLWEERRLAYPIQGHRKGTYWLTYFRADSQSVAGFERQCQLSETILRVLFLKVDPRLVDAMIAHAQVGPAAGRPSSEGDKPPVPVTVGEDDDDIDDIDENTDDTTED
ncbi:MAG: 30S ribosomal protein S6 [Pirellulales bacterium]|nr:30S ribosomal protein S6 [Pirellulales bacterium]